VRAIVLRETGGPENLKLQEIPVPAAGPGEILIKTEAIGATFTEAHMRKGPWQMPLELPVTFGFEAAGTVTATGEGVDKDLRGRRVVIMHIGLGCYAEYVAVPVAAATVVPDGLSSADAVAVANYGAVALCLLRSANLTNKETVLVEVAAGGVGGYLTQLAHASGAGRVIGTAGSQAKRDHVTALGADEVLDHSVPGWYDRLKDIDVVFESLGGDTTGQLLDAVTPGTGRILLYGFLQGPPAATPMDLLTRGLTLTGCAGSEWLDRVAATRGEVMQMALDGHVKPLIDSVLPLADVATAHQRFDDRAAMGQIILIP
jgi:NADPH:quinone reductase-like Zn-dependent oxidoreductase